MLSRVEVSLQHAIHVEKGTRERESGKEKEGREGKRETPRKEPGREKERKERGREAGGERERESERERDRKKDIRRLVLLPLDIITCDFPIIEKRFRRHAVRCVSPCRKVLNVGFMVLGRET